MTKTKSILILNTNGDQTLYQFSTPEAARTEMRRQLAEVLEIKPDDLKFYDDKRSDPDYDPDFDEPDGSEPTDYILEEDFDFHSNSAWAWEDSAIRIYHDWKILTATVSPALPETEIIISLE